MLAAPRQMHAPGCFLGQDLGSLPNDFLMTFSQTAVQTFQQGGCAVTGVWLSKRRWRDVFPRWLRLLTGCRENRHDNEGSDGDNATKSMAFCVPFDGQNSNEIGLVAIGSNHE